MNGSPIDDDAESLYEAELALDGADLRRPAWTVSEISPRTHVTVGIVGAGMSGIIAAHRLRQAGVEVVVFEKNDDVGGTWLENDYPGCRVDIQNHFYSYATAQTPDWPQYHSPQPVLLEYFRTCIERFGVADCIRYSTEVLGARWDETECAWFVDTSSEGREPEQHRLDALVCATGQLNRPSMPDIKGIDDFAGPSFHSARWDSERRLARQARRRDRHRCERRAVHSARRRRRGATSWCSSERRRGSCRCPATKMTCRSRSGPCCATCRSSRTGIASGYSPARKRACCRSRPSIPTGRVTARR